MKFSKEIYLLLARINPSMYDAIYPHTQFQFAGEPAGKLKAGYYQTEGSIFGTDLSGELKVLAKLSWRMTNLTQDLRSIIVHAKVSPEQAGGSNSAGSYISEIADEYCGNGIFRPFPPKPNWVDKKVTIEEKVGAATLFAHAAFAVKGSEIEAALSAGADKILESALAQLGDRANHTNHEALNDIAVSA